MTTLFFDLDGTLIDPAEGIINCLHHAFDTLGIKDVPEDLHWCIGPPLHESLATLVGPDRVDEALAAYRKRYGELGLYEHVVYDGIPDLLADLNRQGYQLCLATSKVKVFADRILTHFDLAQHFQHAFGSELDGSLSNKAELLAHGLAVTGVAAADAVMIGDRKFDMIGASANDIATIGVTWGYGSVEELEQAGAGRLVASVADLAGLFG